jgi:hypothetical protein
MKKDQVYSIKMIGGEEIVAKVLDADDHWTSVSAPLSVTAGPQGIGLMPGMFTADPSAGVQLNRNNIAMYAETDPSVEARYIEATTGIRVPEKKLVLG